MFLIAIKLAHALECDEILERTRAGAPTAAIVEAIEGADELAAGVVSCLSAAGVAPELVAAARRRATALAAPPPRNPPDGATPREAAVPEEVRSGPVAEAVTAYRVGDFALASVRLHTLRANGDTSRQVAWSEGRALASLGLPHAAERSYAALALRGPTDPYWEYTVGALVLAGKKLGDFATLTEIAVSVAPEQFPPSSRNRLTWLRGQRRFEEGADAEALALVRIVNEGDAVYGDARFLEGVLSGRVGKLKSAVRAYTDVARTEFVVDTHAELAAADRRRDRCLLEIAKVYGSIGNWKDADTYVGYVTKDGPLGAQALVEGGWVSYAASQPDALEARLDALEQRKGPPAYVPEAGLLRALAHLGRDRAAEVGRTLDAWNAQWAPVRAELRAVLGEHARDPGRAAAIYRRYLGGRSKSALPEALLEQLTWDHHVAEATSHLAALDLESSRMRTLPTSWRMAVGASLSSLLEADRAALEQRAGTALVAGLTREAVYLDALAAAGDVARSGARPTRPVR